VPNLICPVRGCGSPLARQERSLVCPRGHRFDLARSGYVNLLQPQDRRSRRPGDSAAALAARRRLFDRGHGDWLLPHLLAAFDALPLPSPAPALPALLPALPALPPITAVLDVGCGEGFYLGALARQRPIEAHGLDIAAGAADLAARRYPDATWVVANADRCLPYPTGSFDVAMALTSRLNPAELRRVLARPGSAVTAMRAMGATGATGAMAPPPVAPFDRRREDAGGFLLVAVPGADDLVELRAAVLSEGHLRDRLQPALATLTSLGPGVELLRQVSVRDRLDLAAADLHDLLAATYRGGRDRERQRAAALTRLTVTVSRDIATLRLGPPPAAEPQIR
jgi:23S rRNA (guanine745-N1)-methyltransferase